MGWKWSCSVFSCRGEEKWGWKKLTSPHYATSWHLLDFTWNMDETVLKIVSITTQILCQSFQSKPGLQFLHVIQGWKKKIILLLPINLQKINVVVSLWIPHSQRFTSTCSRYSIVGSYSVFMLPGQYQVRFYLKCGHILFEKKYLYMAVVPAFRLPYFEYFPMLYWMFQFTWSAFKNSY